MAYYPDTRQEKIISILGLSKYVDLFHSMSYDKVGRKKDAHPNSSRYKQIFCYFMSLSFPLPLNFYLMFSASYLVFSSSSLLIRHPLFWVTFFDVSCV